MTDESLAGSHDVQIKQASHSEQAQRVHGHYNHFQQISVFIVSILHCNSVFWVLRCSEVVPNQNQRPSK